MDINVLMGIVFLAAALMDSIMVKLVMPRVFEKRSATNPNMDTEKASKMLRMLNVACYVFFVLGLLALLIKPLKN